MNGAARVAKPKFPGLRTNIIFHLGVDHCRSLDNEYGILHGWKVPIELSWLIIRSTPLRTALDRMYVETEPFVLTRHDIRTIGLSTLATTISM